MFKSKAITDAQTLEEVVNLINSGGTVEGMENVEFSPEALAGQYGFDAAKDACYGIDAATIGAHLAVLQDMGARFDTGAAWTHAAKLAASETGQRDSVESYRVVNYYGIGGSVGQVHYTPKAVGKKAYDRCETWIRRNDTANTMRVVDYRVYV